MTERFLEVEPRILKFPFVRNQHSKCWLTLTNKSPNSIAFKALTTHQKKYRFRPNRGAISPNSCFVVEVIRMYEKVAVSVGLLREKSIIQTIVAKNGENFTEVTTEMFREAGIDVEEHRLRVVLLGADSPEECSQACGFAGDSDRVENHHQERTSQAQFIPDENKHTEDKLQEEASKLLKQYRRLLLLISAISFVIGFLVAMCTGRFDG